MFSHRYNTLRSADPDRVRADEVQRLAVGAYQLATPQVEAGPMSDSLRLGRTHQWTGVAMGEGGIAFESEGRGLHRRLYDLHIERRESGGGSTKRRGEYHQPHFRHEVDFLNTVEVDIVDPRWTSMEMRAPAPAPVVDNSPDPIPRMGVAKTSRRDLLDNAGHQYTIRRR